MTSAVIYARISADLQGQGLGVARQVEDCERKAAALGWTVADHFTDNDLSASKSVVRPAYARMLAGIESGEIEAVVVYDLDRLTRRPAELEAFIDLTATHGVLLANVSGDVDLTTANGRMVARIKGAVARQEADRIGERTTRQKQQRVQQGKPLGQRFRTFGYTRSWEVIEDEADIVREVFRRAAAGESQNGITRDLRARDVRTAAGGEWTALQTSRMLRTPKYAGFQTYKGQVVGKSSVVPALVTEAQYEAVQQPQNGASYNLRKHLLSGLLICDSCKAPMSGTRVVNKGKESARYRCDTRSGGCGRVSIKASWVEGMVSRYMSNMVVQDYMARREAQESKSQDNTDAIAAIDQRIEALQEAGGRGEMEMGDLLAALKVARAERGRLTREDAQRVTEEVGWDKPLQEYDDLDLSAKRVEIQKFFRYIFVKPGRRVRYFDERRIEVMLTFDEGDVRRPGGAVNVVDMREPLGTGTHLPFDERPFDPDVGF